MCMRYEAGRNIRHPGSLLHISGDYAHEISYVIQARRCEANIAADVGGGEYPKRGRRPHIVVAPRE